MIDQLQQAYEAEYERKAAEMRHLVNQAYMQLAAATRDLENLRTRIKELEELLERQSS